MNELDWQLSALVSNSPVQWLDNPFSEPVSIRLFLKRDDLLHPLVSGNKWRKLKYNLLAARERGNNMLLTFGGAYSNHLYATAAAGRALNFRTIGIVRGDELAHAPLNSTLAFCQLCGMHLHFISRTDYRRKDTPEFLTELTEQFGPFYLLPEGGTNDLAIGGTAEIMPELITQLGYVPNYVCCPVGTGGTVAGLAKSASTETTVLGFMALKIPTIEPAAGWLPITDYHFGGYARTTPVLVDFIRAFEKRNDVLIEQVYTGKMLYGIYDLARQGYFSDGATVVAVHTGGLQGRSAELD